MLTIQRNLGMTDRIVRSLLGSYLMVTGLQSLKKSSFWGIKVLVGTTFLAEGCSGYDPVLAAYGASTIPGANNNILNMIKSVLPGQGISPWLSQFVMPKKPLLIQPFPDNLSLAKALVIG